MIKNIKLILLILLICLLQISIAPNISILEAFPNLNLIVLVILLLCSRYKEALVWAIISGLIIDIYLDINFIYYTLGFLLVFILFYFIFKKIISTPILPIVILAFFLSGLLVDFLPMYLNQKNYFIYIYCGIYNTLLGVIMYYLLVDIVKEKENIYQLK